MLLLLMISAVPLLTGCSSKPPKYVDAGPFSSNAALYSYKYKCFEGEADQANTKVSNREGVEIIQGEEEDTCAKVRILTGDYKGKEGWMSPM